MKTVIVELTIDQWRLPEVVKDIESFDADFIDNVIEENMDLFYEWVEDELQALRENIDNKLDSMQKHITKSINESFEDIDLDYIYELLNEVEDQARTQ